MFPHAFITNTDIRLDTVQIQLYRQCTTVAELTG